MVLLHSLAKLLAALAGNSIQHIKNSVDFKNKIQDIKVPAPFNKQVSYDVSALFTSIPILSALEIAKSRLKNDPKLMDRSELNVEQLVSPKPLV